MGPWRTFARVTLPQVRPALLGGGLVVALDLLAEYGGFKISSTGPSRWRSSRLPARLRPRQRLLLSLVLVVIGVLVLGGEWACAGRRGTPRAPRGAPAGARAARPTAPRSP